MIRSVILSLFYFIICVSSKVNLKQHVQTRKILDKHENSNFIHEKIVIHRYDDKIILQKGSIGCIELNVHNNSLKINQLNVLTSKLIDSAVKVQSADALYGIYKLPSGYYIALITKSEDATEFMVKGCRIVKEITLIHIPNNATQQNLNRTQQIEVENLLIQTFNRHQFYYSTSDYDITRSYQYNMQTKQTIKSWSKADERFFWNFNTVSYLINLNLDKWITPITNAWVSMEEIELKGKKLQLSLISRRSRRRQGPR